MAKQETRKHGPWGACEECPLRELHRDRHGNIQGRFVPASGPEDAPLLVVGEAPGRNESDFGYPFAGKSGALLRRALKIAGIDPETEVRYCNTVACQPPGNRNPAPLEQHLCPQLREELRSFQGRVVLAVGRQAANRLLGVDLTTEVVASRSTWDGYCWPVPERAVELGSALLNAGDVYKSGKKKGEPKLSRKTLYGEPIPRQDVEIVTCLHPAGVARKGFSNLFQMKAAIWIAGQVLRGKRPLEPINEYIDRPDGWQLRDSSGLDLAFDIENTSEGLTRIGFAEVDSEGQILRVGSFPWSPAARELAIRLLGPESSYRWLLAHNAAYDVTKLKQMAGVEVDRQRVRCTMLAAQLDQPDLPKGLGAMWRYIGPMRPWKHLSEEQPGVYNAHDALVCALAWGQGLRPLLAKKGQLTLYENEMSSLFVIDKMTQDGMRVDGLWAREKAKRVKEKLAAAKERWQAVSGLEVTSGKQVIAFFYEKLGLPILERTETGIPSTSEATLRRLLDLGEELPAEGREGIEALLEMRENQKILSTYLEGLLAKCVDGRLHPSYLPDTKDSSDLGTAAGRLRSSPNVQNVPKDLRPMFIPDDRGMVIGDTDLSAVEGRVAAVLAGDSELLEMYDDPSIDMHMLNLENALASLRVLWEERAKSARTKEEREFWKERIAVDRQWMATHDSPREHPTLDRRRIKTFLYGYQYGAGDRKIADSLKLHLREAECIRKAYEESRPKTTAWRNAVIADARSKKLLQNSFGRIRYFQGVVPDAHVRNAAINFGPQSTVADMFWELFPKAAAALEALGGRLLTQVHDSFVWQAPAEKALEAAAAVEKVLTQEWPQIAPGFRVPATTEIGPRWGRGMSPKEWVAAGRPSFHSYGFDED